MDAPIHQAFADHCIVSCGMLHPEINYLVESGFMKPKQIYFTPPGLHALPDKLEQHLLRRLNQATQSFSDDKIIVVYGKKCHICTKEPLKRAEFHTITLDHFKRLLLDALQLRSGEINHVEA